MSGSGSRDRYRIRLASSRSDVEAAQRLRRDAFQPVATDGLDADDFDAHCLHFLVEEVREDTLVATFRVLHLGSGAEIGQSYSAQFYDLSALEAFPHAMAEVGRFCARPGTSDPDVLRRAWGVLTAFVDREEIGMLFGCSSFAGTDHLVYADAFGLLRDSHLAPGHFRPGIKSDHVVRFEDALSRAPDRQRALRTMPSLLRSYLAIGGWVSDHAVIDREMNTLHVFTGLEIERIPAARARVLRAVAV